MPKKIKSLKNHKIRKLRMNLNMTIQKMTYMKMNRNISLELINIDQNNINKKAYIYTKRK